MRMNGYFLKLGNKFVVLKYEALNLKKETNKSSGNLLQLSCTY